MKVAVIGAGIVGLAAATELLEAGAEVHLYEKAEVAGAQSKGLTRIFRLAHGEARMVELASRARTAWQGWEQRFGRRLIGDEGVILTGAAIVQEWGSAMAAAGAPHRLLDRAEVQQILPIGNLPDCPALFDPSGGSTRVRRTVELLRARVGSNLIHADVLAVEPASSGAVVHIAEGNDRYDEVLITAGIDSSGLATGVGLEMPMELKLHSRFTFPIRHDYLDKRISCWIDDSGMITDGAFSYAQPVGHTGRYAIGVSWTGQDNSPEVGAEEVSRQSRERAIAYVQEALPGLIPEPVDEIRCVSNQFPFLDGDDGFQAWRGDHVTVLYGNNLFKFAPLLGALLRDAVLQGRVPEALEPAPRAPGSFVRGAATVE